MKPINHLLFLLLLSHCNANSDPTALIYHRCTTAAVTSLPITAEYQCRGDMTSTACQRCIAQLGILSNTLCAGSSAQPARVQLRGCYAQYEAEEEDTAMLLYKGCGERVVGYDGVAKNGALGAAEEGIVRSGSGFYTAASGGVKAAAQCGRELMRCDCGECVSRAAEVLREDCAGAVGGEVYFHGCYVTFATTYIYPSGYKKIGTSGKLVAIVLGGASSIGLVFILFMFFKSCGKKDDD